MKPYKFHYVYRITNFIDNKHYYGARSTNMNPIEELGISYFSSSLDGYFKEDQLLNTNNYKYKIIRIFENREDAISFEIYLHNKFNVAINPNFYNNAKQTSTGFDRLGKLHTNETKNKIGEKNKNRKVSEETRSKLSDLSKGRVLSKETKEKMSKPKSQETKEKMRLNALNRSPELQQKMNESQKGWKHTEETKKKISNSRKNKYTNE